MAGVCPVTRQCEEQGLCDPVSVHDQEQEELVRQSGHERT